jgi:Tol biopolymer transport system component
MDPNGNSLVRRTTTTGFNEVTPAWSTDSTTLVYARTPVGGTNSDIYKLKLSPVTTTALVTNAAADITPDW